ncbi:hypothetical protein LCGC14_0566960 [marine sediment metagenome]|uniref:Uncharacterized protein n=1 Tax=marine sediment metagenome TaxID=412755 RepID=A0A0F9RQK2_9ZZZZ
MSEPEPKITYDKFKEFYDKHPDLDNSEYYAEFPTGNKSTIRSWKNKAAPKATPKATPPDPPPATKDEGFDAMQSEYIQLLTTQTKSNATEFEGLEEKSILVLLKNRLRAQQELKPPSRASNGPILPTPKPIGQTNKKFGIDDYIVFDTVKNEIRAEIPMDTVMDPEKNKILQSHN